MSWKSSSMNTMRPKTADTRSRLSEALFSYPPCFTESRPRFAQRLDATPFLFFVEYDDRCFIAFATGALAGHGRLS
jgi:hypothetical protein